MNRKIKIIQSRTNIMNYECAFSIGFFLLLSVHRQTFSCITRAKAINVNSVHNNNTVQRVRGVYIQLNNISFKRH